MTFNVEKVKESLKASRKSTAFKNMKFKVTSPEQSKEIQEALFSMGYGWEQYGKEVKWIGNDNAYTYLNTDESGILTRSWKDPDCDVTQSSPFYHQEHTIKTTKSYELVAVEIPKPAPTIKLNGEMYTQEEVASAVQFLKFVRGQGEIFE